jgi:hypothetical protein
MTTNWDETFTSLPPEELDALAVLRIVECTNGIIQFMYRDKDPEALSLEETRTAMGFSMSSIKRMQIVLEDETIHFAEPTKDIMGKVRELYISGMKRNDDADYAEFMKASVACMKACGYYRLKSAKDKLFSSCYAFPAYTYDWGLSYCCSLLGTNTFK